MYAAGAGSGEADAETAGVFGVADGGERGGLFVAHLNEADFVLMSSEGFEDAVHAIAGQSKNSLNTPIDKPCDQQVGDGSRHSNSSHLKGCVLVCIVLLSAQRTPWCAKRAYSHVFTFAGFN